MVTAGGPYYGPLATMDFDQARRDVEQHLWLHARASPATRPARCAPAARCCSSAARAVVAQPSATRSLSTLTAGLPALTKGLALELAPVRVNVIAPGFVDTPLSASILGDQLDERREQLRTTLPIGRVVGPEDVAALAVHIMTNTALTGGHVRHRRRPTARRRLSSSSTSEPPERRYTCASRHRPRRHVPGLRAARPHGHGPQPQRAAGPTTR